MKKFFNFFILFAFVFLLFKIYSAWFVQPEIISGDWPFFYKEMVKEFTLVAPIWNPQTPLGEININFPLLSYEYFIGALFSNILNISWSAIYKVFWFGFFLGLASFSITCLIKIVFNKPTILQVVFSIFIYLANTYILMIVGGGQMGIALAYSLAPLVLAMFIKSSNLSYLKFSMKLGLVLGLQMLFDIRILYITLIVVFLYYFLALRFKIKNVSNSIIYVFVIPIAIATALHFYWIFPFFYFKLFSVPAGLTSVSGFNFFSFADFSHALSLLHPNWPENIFGKTYFLKPEFILLPIMAFSALLFIGSKSQKNDEPFGKLRAGTERRRILFFVTLGLIGAFLAKGVNPPFGKINQWLFLYIPGMNMFRDSTKFYLMIAISYSVLVPFTILRISDFLSSNKKISIFIKFKLSKLFLIFVISYLIFLIKPAVLGKLGGTFNSYQVPIEYQKLNDFVMSQKEYFGTFWVPMQSRFRFQTENHPLVTADSFYKTANDSAIAKNMQDPKTEKLLEKIGIKYVIIPYDSTNEIFLTDRRYDNKKRLALEKELDKITWLKKIQKGKITVYETLKHKDKFWLKNQGTLSYKNITNLEFEINFNSKTKNTIIFPNIYNKYWQASFDSQIINSVKTAEGFNSFQVPKGEYKIKIYFLPQRDLNFSYLLSGIIFVTIITTILVFSKKNE